jgi:hypothetical protein
MVSANGHFQIFITIEILFGQYKMIQHDHDQANYQKLFPLGHKLLYGHL